LRGGDVVVRLPLTLHNTGAAAIVVASLRVIAEGSGELHWESTHPCVRPEPNDFLDVPAPFTVTGRAAAVVFAEFMQEPARWLPAPASSTRLRVERLDARGRRRLLCSFPLWAPAREDDMGAQIAHQSTRLVTRDDPNRWESTGYVKTTNPQVSGGFHASSQVSAPLELDAAELALRPRVARGG
jgi:hypothetical protein